MAVEHTASSAAFPKRILAAILDILVSVVAFVAMSLVFGTKTESVVNGVHSYRIALTGLPSVVYLLLILAYFVVLEWRFGATLGKMATHIHVVNSDGGRITLKQSLIRNLLRVVDGFPYIAPYATGTIVALCNTSKQRVGDAAANTFVAYQKPSTETSWLVD